MKQEEIIKEYGKISKKILGIINKEKNKEKKDMNSK